jgi:hypothetical protein
MLARHDIHACGAKLGDQPVVGVQRIGQQQILDPGSMRRFRIELGDDAVPGVTTIPRFRHLEQYEVS